MNEMGNIMFSEKIECASQILYAVYLTFLRRIPTERNGIIRMVADSLSKKQIEMEEEGIGTSVELLIKHDLIMEDEDRLLFPGKELSMNFYDFLLLYEPWLKNGMQNEDEKMLREIPVYNMLFLDLWEE